MSEYCLLDTSIDRKIVGCYTQTMGVPDGFTFKMYDKPNSMTKLNNKEFPKENPELIWQMEPKAKLTDVVSASNITARGLLCNDKVRDILEKHKLCEHRFYPATLIYQNSVFDYHWFHPIEQDLDIIDFEKSEFAITDYFRDSLNELIIRNMKDFKYKFDNKAKGTIISLTKLIAKVKYDISIFSYILHDDFIISINFKNYLEHHRIKGIKFHSL
tara:strand:- start:55 stop:699 length:645 start_codon:yes stop_codon:yes gene_type:complete